MNIFCCGISHHTAPVEIREKLWFGAPEIPGALAALRDAAFREAVLVSTCNRTECYFVPSKLGPAGEPVWELLARFKHASDGVTVDNFYNLEGPDAVRHLYKVASGIDSMVLGDVQILNQMKEAFTTGQELNSTGVLLNRLFHTALHVGKRARTETEIAEGAVSVSYAAAELASKIFEDLSRKTALLIGAGETGELTARHLVGRNLGTLLVANRTRERAEELVRQLGGSVAAFDDLKPALTQADIVISSVASPGYVLGAAELKSIMKQRGHRTLVIIDIGVPRNIDPAANTIDNIFLNDIDSLNHIVDTNLDHRRAEIPKIESIIDQEFDEFRAWYASLGVAPTIQLLREQFEGIRQTEVEKHLHHFSSEHRETVDMLTKRIINKILHTPMVNLRTGAAEQHDHDMQTKVSVLRHLFGLDKPQQHE